MSKKKSLGSSPIAFKSEKSTMGFIPDRGVSKNKKDNNTAVIAKNQTKDKRKQESRSSSRTKAKKKNKKKIVSYYLETNLINKIKSIADNNDMYYSALVTSALKYWIANNN